MPRPVAWFCLLIALNGPLLTHAEAADDLARSLVELLDRGHIETPDGGVGDDPIVASVWRAVPILDPVQLAMPDWAGFADAAPLDLPSREGGTLRRGRRGDPWPFPEPFPRHAWLQHFLI